MIVRLNLDPLAREVFAWIDGNFAGRTEHDARLVLAEEAGELASALCREAVKRSQGIRSGEALEAATFAEIGDVVISALDFCRAHGTTLAEVVDRRWAETVCKRDWRKEQP